MLGYPAKLIRFNRMPVVCQHWLAKIIEGASASTVVGPMFLFAYILLRATFNLRPV